MSTPSVSLSQISLNQPQVRETNRFSYLQLGNPFQNGFHQFQEKYAARAEAALHLPSIATNVVLAPLHLAAIIMDVAVAAFQKIANAAVYVANAAHKTLSGRAQKAPEETVETQSNHSAQEAQDDCISVTSSEREDAAMQNLVLFLKELQETHSQKVDEDAAPVATLEENEDAASVVMLEENEDAASVVMLEENEDAAPVATLEENEDAASVATLEGEAFASAALPAAPASPQWVNAKVIGALGAIALGTAVYTGHLTSALDSFGNACKNLWTGNDGSPTFSRTPTPTPTPSPSPLETVAEMFVYTA